MWILGPGDSCANGDRSRTQGGRERAFFRQDGKEIEQVAHTWNPATFHVSSESENGHRKKWVWNDTSK